MKILAIDGNSIINRAYYGVRQLTAGDGTPTGAVYGFLNILQKLTAEESPDKIVVMFDTREKTFRHEQYGEYKAHRTGMPDELAVQMPILKEILDAMGITRCEKPGWEADDLLGTAAAQSETAGHECVIVTGDKDALQLVSDKTRVKHVKTAKGQTETRDYTPEVFFSEYGFPPRKIIDLKALMGDTSDNIPGVKGVGEKTALDLVQRLGGVDEIYKDIETADMKDTVRKKLISGKEDAYMSYKLAEIMRNAPLDFDVLFSEAENTLQDDKKLLEIFTRLGFTKLTQKLITNGAELQQDTERVTVNTVTVTADGELRRVLERCMDAERVPVMPDDGFSSVSVLCGDTVYTISRAGTPGYDEFLNTLLSGSVKKAGHNIKDIMRQALETGRETDGWVFDTALAAYLISPTDSNYDLRRISARYAGFTVPESAGGTGQMSMLEETVPDTYQSDAAFAIGKLCGVLDEKMREMSLSDVFYDIELPLCRTLAEMEHTGFLVDRNALVEYGKMLSEGIEGPEAVIYELAGEEFNINSPKQLGVVLFEKLMLPPPKKTKTGYSTSVEVLDSLLGKHPIIEHVKDFRELTKLKSTYADGLLKVIHSSGRIHTRFQMTVTATGRLSSIEPNLQNIPIRKPSGEQLRKMFIASDGNVLVGADYSQIELRLLAHIANDPVMQKAFENGEDIHTVTASQVFGVSPGEVTTVMRGRAKAVNFGIVYGISAFSLARDIGVAAYEAKTYIDNYLEKYSGVREYMKQVVEKAREDGYVTTLYGRRRALPELKSQKHNERMFGERVALNMPIQGTAADIIKIAMINVSKRLKQERSAAKLILQVHDELIVECPEQEAERVSEILCHEMENAAKLTVPLIAEAHYGKSWHDAK